MFTNIKATTDYWFHLDTNEVIGHCNVFPSRYLDNAVELWAFSIIKEHQGKGYGQAALAEIIRYFIDNGDIDDGEAVMKLLLQLIKLEVNDQMEGN